MSAARPSATVRCAWCRGRFTISSHAAASGPRMVLCPYCGCAADARAGLFWRARLAEALLVRMARAHHRLRRRLWALGAGHLVRFS